MLTESASGSAESQLVAAIRLDLQGATPLYVQVRNGLIRMIKEGLFGAHDALPSERSLAEMLGVSRVTARKAIGMLSAEGLIVRRQGSGNYIAPLLEQPLTMLTSFTEELKQRGFSPSSRWIRRTLGVALPDEMAPLGLSPGACVARLERVRLADGVPMAYEASTLPVAVLPNPEEVESSLYVFLSEHGKTPARALQHIRAVNAGARHAELLEIPEGKALLFISRVSYLEDGRAIELTHTWCRSDYYDFVAELRR